MKKSQFNFTWLFAIISGIMILLLAIYGASRIGEMKQHETDTEVGKTLDIITDPMQAGWADALFPPKIEFKQETRINNNCNDFEFGKNSISVSTESSVGEKWKQPGEEIAIRDKYIFSSLEQGKTYYVFSKAFEFPYKVSDLIFLSARKYCFTDAPTKIARDLDGFSKNIEIENCSSGSVQVCFGSGDECDIIVRGDEESGYVMKDDEQYWYVGNLLYGAIFSDKDVYDCNVKRLLYRAGKIAEVYIEAGRGREVRGIGTNLIPYLTVFKGVVMNATSDDLVSLEGLAEEIDGINNREGVGLW